MRLQCWHMMVGSLCLAITIGCGGSKDQPVSKALPKPMRSAKPDAVKGVTNTSLEKRAVPAAKLQPPDAPPAGKNSLANDTSGAVPQPFNLFAPPRAELPVIKQSAERENNDPVRLIGFVNVKTEQALLAFEGKIRGMEVGETFNNVEVIDIDPPKVTLQRGKERWITTLFDQPIVNNNNPSRTAGSASGPRVTVGQSQDAASRNRSNQWPDATGYFPGAGVGNINPNQGVNGGSQGAPLLPFPPLPGGENNGAGQIPLPPLPQLPGAPTDAQ